MAAKHKGIAGEYGTLENLWKVNYEVGFVNHTLLEKRIADAFTSNPAIDPKTRRCYPDLEEHVDAHVEMTPKGKLKIVVDGAYERWVGPGEGFYNKISKGQKKREPRLTVPVDGKPSEVDWKGYITALEEALSYEGSLNEYGKAASKVASLRQKLADYLRSEEGQSISNGKARLIALALGCEDENTLMQVLNTEEGSILTISNGYPKKVRRSAAEYKLKEETMDRKVVDEELEHMQGKKVITDDIGTLVEEFRAKNANLKRYEKLASQEKDPEKRREYARLVAAQKDDINTTFARYSGLYESAAKAGYSARYVDGLISEGYRAARAKGLKGKEAEDYAAEYAAEKTGAKEEKKSDSKEKGKSSKGKEASKKGEAKEGEDAGKKEGEAESDPDGEESSDGGEGGGE